MNLKTWAVTKRLEASGYKVPEVVKPWLLKNYLKMSSINSEDIKGIYQDLGRNGIVFIGSIYSRDFPLFWGWLPETMPYNDPYQPVPKGKTAWFKDYLKSIGFKEVIK
ncbi:hypothetical protein DRO30_01355 [Candidatus Bathyarchaeota archaeon]|nr:MAG: hypothetical protein DRO30_01355 [Candidatus Bathyarchaeota archaeon]